MLKEQLIELGLLSERTPPSPLVTPESLVTGLWTYSGAIPARNASTADLAAEYGEVDPVE